MSANWLKDLSLIPRPNTVQTFKSYVDLSEESDGNLVAEYPVEAGDHKDKEVYDEIPKPHLMPSLLPGEVVIAKAENVLKFNTLSELNRGISGALVCTNFKLSFVTTKKFPSSLHQRNLLLSENDICLINVDAIYQVIGGKRRKLSQANPPSNAEIIEVHCKDFRIFTFSFKFCPAAQKSIISTILHHAFVPRINLLFAFDYQEPPSYAEENLCNSLVFTKASDWETELRRCNCPGWRVTHVNEKYLLCDSLPECFVVPSVLLDMNLSRAAPYFAGHRVPTWSWGLSCGVSLVRMAGVDSSISDNKQRELMVDAISRASPRQKVVKVIDVSELCPSPKEIQSSFVKLKDLCMPTTSEEYWGKDSNYLSDLDSTKWLTNVSSCLQVALEAASAIQRKETVVISEYEGRDVCCIISSLVQMILDPHYRTQIGFQTLIQKEWVALGHPFTERLRHISGCEAEESPVFLLFLDCVWQLIQQCPAVFDFSETYLTTLWDSCHISIFDTFLLTSPKSRQDVLLNKGGGSSSFCLRSVWNWSRQFSRNDVKLFYNPLYVLNKYRDIAAGRRSPSSGRPRSFTSVKDSRHSMRRPLMVGNVIKPVVWDEDEENLSAIDPFVKSLSFWHQCYLRWIPLAHIVGGGSPILYLNNLKLANEIRTLEKIINSLSTKTKHPRPPQRHRRAASDDYIISADSIDIQEGCNVVTSAFPFSSVSPWDWHSFQFVPSMSCLQISYTETDDHPDD